MERIILFITLAIVIPLVKCLVPGTFFWKPRLALDLTLPTEKTESKVVLPSRQNIQAGIVVLIDGFELGMVAVILGETYTDTTTLPHLNPTRAAYHNNAYRWALRHLNLLPNWLGGRGKYCDTHKLWTRRYYYLDAFVPDWLQKVLFYVDKKDWEQDKKDFIKYSKYAEPGFGKHYKYPSKVFNDFKEFDTEETVENLDDSSASLVDRRRKL